jgi:murein DD-endopeptidase MepM/ murein hydrolase activator NlpD
MIFQLPTNWYSKMIKRSIYILLTLLLLFSPKNAIAQDQSTGPIYIVQEGDNLNTIAAQFDISVTDLMVTNNISNANLISIGMQLIIPGVNGVSGYLTTSTIPLGASLQSLSRTYNMPVSTLIQINRLVSPAEVYAGATLILALPQLTDQPTLTPVAPLLPGSSPLQFAIQHNTSLWTVILQNQLDSPWQLPIGEPLALNSSALTTTWGSPNLQEVTITPLPIQQGSTTTIRIHTNQSATLSGSLADKELHFFTSADNDQIALQGVHRMNKPGIYPFHLKATFANGSSYEFEQTVLLKPMPSIFDYPLSVDPATTDPTTTSAEDELVRNITAQATPTRYWQGKFIAPIDVAPKYRLYPDCVTSDYGNLRSYNGSPYNFYHTGLDLFACGNTLNIYAPAPGVVVFADNLTVRGGYTVIDHGWGVYSAYGHQSEIRVQVGEHVETGQLIGLIGKTGRVDGPHLHWEVWVNGILVNPLEWLKNDF